MKKQEKIIRVLLVEDNLDDIKITQRALLQANMPAKLWIVRDGQEALDYLYHKGQFDDHEAYPRPSLILLDINLPKVNGLEVLKIIKGDELLKMIPVIMLTMSKRHEDVVKAYQHGCNSFIQKPVGFEEFLELVRQLGTYWGGININLPQDSQDSEENI